MIMYAFASIAAVFVPAAPFVLIGASQGDMSIPLALPTLVIWGWMLG